MDFRIFRPVILRLKKGDCEIVSRMAAFIFGPNGKEGLKALLSGRQKQYAKNRKERGLLNSEKQEEKKQKARTVESIIKCRRNRYGFSCIIFLSEGRRKEVKTLNGYSYLTLEQRREIERMYAEGERVVDIAARLKRSAAAIYEELKRGYTGEFDGYARPKYSADLAQATVQENFRRRGNRRGANC